MLDKFKRKSATAKPPIKAPPAPAAKTDHEVNRALFTLPSATWAAIDTQRQGTGLTVAQYITALVLKAGK
jgi:hypothetical protein